MAHIILHFFDERLVSIAYFLFPVLLVFMQTAIWDWQTNRRLARGSMFFGARVGPEFIASACADLIVKRFRLRIWCLALAIIFACILIFGRDSLAPKYLVGSSSFVFFAPMIGNLIMFGLANREAKKEADILPGLTTRTATLFVEQDESSAWLTIADWAGILLPIGIPLATVFVTILYWNQFPPNWGPLAELRHILLTGVIGLIPAGTYFALRFRARSRDWAPNPRASRQYRTLLGLTQSSVFSFIIFNSCWSSLTDIKGEPFGAMNTHSRYSVPASFGFILVLLGIKMYFRKNLARESSDPMPDSCWKWGYFYYNRNDSALVVPSRAGTGFSYNHASHSVWIVGGLVLAVTLFGFLSFFMS